MLEHAVRRAATLPRPFGFWRSSAGTGTAPILLHALYTASQRCPGELWSPRVDHPSKVGAVGTLCAAAAGNWKGCRREKPCR